MNLILQHWCGEPTEIEKHSWLSIERYAARIGAEHRVLSGEPMGKVDFPYMHKLHLFDRDFDEFDTVVMMDSDMFAPPAAGSIFDVPGIGVFGPLQVALRRQIRERMPAYFDGTQEADYYGGAVYKFDRADRERFRAHLKPEILPDFDAYEFGCDEGVIHYLATVTGTKGRALPGGERWACSSFDKNVVKAHLVHVRRRISEGKLDKRPKIENWSGLVDAGVLAA